MTMSNDFPVKNAHFADIFDDYMHFMDFGRFDNLIRLYTVSQFNFH